jgi:small-conductance mechanosensitive channel
MVAAALSRELHAQAPETTSSTSPSTGLIETMPPEQEVVVTYLNRPITTLRARILASRPAQRANAAVAILDELVHDNVTGPVTTRMVKGILMINVGGRDVMSLVDADINRLTDETLEQRGADAAERLRVALAEAQESRRVNRLARGALFSLAATALFGFILVGGRRLHRRGVNALHTMAGRELDRFAVRTWWKDHDSLVSRTAHVVMSIALLTLAALVTYWWVQFVLRQFPYTRPWGESLRQYLLAFVTRIVLGVANAIPGLLFIAVIVLGTKAAIAVSNSFFESIERGTFAASWSSPDTARASRRIAAALLWMFAIVIAYPYMPGSGSDAFKGVSVFLGVIISLGSSGLVNQLISGLTMTYSHALRVGDVIKTGDVEGEVTYMGPFSIQVRNAQDELVTVPYAVVIGQGTTNYTRLAPEGAVLASTDVTIGYDAPWRQVHALLLLAADRTEGVLRDPAPRVQQRALEDFYVRYRLVVAVAARMGKPRTLDALLANIQDAFNEHGVQILSPNFESQPHQPAVVPRERWYEAPATPPPGLRSSSGRGG